MSEETLSYVDIAARRNSSLSILLAGWPTERVAKIHSLLATVVPQTSAADDTDRTLQNPFSERLSKLRQPADIDFVRRELSRNENSMLFVFVEDLASLLARELAKGSDADLGVAREWQVSTDRLLAMVDRDDARAKIISIADVEAFPGAFVDYLSGLLSWPLRFAVEPDAYSRSKWEDFHLLIAKQYTQDHLDLRRLDAELQARRDFVPLPSPGHSTRVDWSEVLHDVTSVRQENTVLLEMLHRVQSEYEQSMLKLGDSDEAKKQLTADLAAAQEKSSTLAGKLTNVAGVLETTKDKLQQQASRAQRLDAELYETKASRRTTVAKLKATSAKLSAKEEELRKARGLIAALKGSTSWKLTAPARSIVGWFKG